jgi:glycosyltransferase involved in cell wall biosynthesis
MRRAEGPIVVAIDGSTLADGRGVAGIGRYANELLTGLRALDGRVQVHVAVPGSSPRSNRWSYRYARSQPGMANLVRRARPQVVHGPASEAAMCFPLARQVVTVHDVIPWTGLGPHSPDVRAYLRLQWELVSRAGAIIVPSKVVVGDVVSVFGVAAERITAIEHGVSAAFSSDPGEDDRAIRADAALDRAPFLIWVGSLHGPDPRKGLDVLFDALRALDPGSRPLLALVGKHGIGSEWAREQADAIGIEVVLPGYVEDSRLAALYRGATAAVVPSRYEGFGLPALEAMASGAPVIVTDAGNSPAVVGSAAVVVPAGDARALASALQALLEDPALRDRLRHAGPLQASGFSWTQAAERTVEVYERVLASSRARGGGWSRQRSRVR